MLLYGFESHSGLEFSDFSMWYFLKLVVRGFLRVLRFPPLLHWLMVLAKVPQKYLCDFNSVKLNSWSVPSYQVAHDTLHVIGARCVACDLYTIPPGPLEHMCWRQFAVLWGDCKKSWTAPLNAIIIIIPVHILKCHWTVLPTNIWSCIMNSGAT